MTWEKEVREERYRLACWRVLRAAVGVEIFWAVARFSVWAMVAVTLALFGVYLWKYRRDRKGTFFVEALVANVIVMLFHVFQVRADILPNFAGVMGILCVIEVLISYTSKDRAAILLAWRRLGLSLKHFPKNSTERGKIANWAEDFLRSLARVVTVEFDQRKLLELQWENGVRHYQSVTDDQSQCSPKGLARYRKYVANAECLKFIAERLHREACRRAEQAEEKYNLAWDLFVKGEQEGIGVLAKLQATNPNAYRSEIAKEDAKNAHLAARS